MFGQALIGQPPLTRPLRRFRRPRSAMEAPQAALSALNLPSAGDVERLERRVRSLSQRLEDAEEQIDDSQPGIGTLQPRKTALAKAEMPAKRKRPRRSPEAGAGLDPSA